MLIADDQRRWVTGNAAACDLLGIAREEIPWRTMDEFTSPGERKRLEDQWGRFLASGGAEGWYELYVPDRGPVPVEFSATANVLPARHLSVFIPPDSTADPPIEKSLTTWAAVPVEGSGRLRLSERECEVMTLVAAGFQSGEIAQRLFLSPETVKSHVHNALGKLEHTLAPTRWQSHWPPARFPGRSKAIRTVVGGAQLGPPRLVEMALDGSW